MPRGIKEIRNWAALLIGIALAIPVPFLSSVFLRIAANVFGPRIFWFIGFLFCASVYFAPELSPVLLFVVSVWVLVGAFAFFEHRGRGNFWTAALSVFLATMVAWQGPVILEYFGIGAPDTSLQKNLELMVQKIEKDPDQRAWIEAFGLTKDVLMAQLPSVLALLYIMCLAFALVFDRRVAALMRVKFEHYVGGPRLLDFRVPDVLIWFFLLSFLLSFLQLGQVSIVALNVLQVFLGAYFFQGLAILETTLLIFRFGPLFKAMIYILIVGNLFFLLSLVGLADYWVDFRDQLKRWRLKQSKAE